MLNATRRLLIRYRSQPGLEVLLNGAPKPTDPLRERIRWLLRLFRWLRPPGRDGKLPAARLKHFLGVLSRNESWKANVAGVLRSIIHETDALELFATTGIPSDGGFSQELGERMHANWLPQAPEDHDLRAVFASAFKNAEDAAWILEIGEDQLTAIDELLHYGPGGSDPGWNTLVLDAREALSLLAHSVRVQGLSRMVRARMSRGDYRNLPFFSLTGAVETFLKAPRDSNEAAQASLFTAIRGCSEATAEVEEEFKRSGVSLSSIYRLGRIKTMLGRMETLTRLLGSHSGHELKAARNFLSYLAAENARSRTVGGLFRDIGMVVSRKIVEFNAAAGEHYIAREREGRMVHWKRALGGGVIVALLTLLKSRVHHISDTLFVAGFVDFLCYAAAFLSMQFLGFTLATKMPAMTANSLAARLESDGERGTLRTEAAHLIRTQMVSVLGNLCAAIPVVLMIFFALRALGLAFLSPSEAVFQTESFSFFGPTPLLAAWTGVELWICSVVAGAVDNWFAYHRLPAAIEHHEGLGMVLGNRRRNLADWLSHHLGAFAGNIMLAFFFGMFPYLTQFFGFRLEGRHVTVSAASLTASTATLGPGALEGWPFWLGVVGVISMAAMNILISFGLALTVAIWARGDGLWHRRSLYLRLVAAFFKR